MPMRRLDPLVSLFPCAAIWFIKMRVTQFFRVRPLRICAGTAAPMDQQRGGEDAAFR